MARTCYMCPNPAESREHVIPNAVGGRWKEFGLLCTSCNSAFGRTIDAALCREVGTPMNMLGLTRERGDVPRQVVRVASGENYLRDVDGTLTLKKARVREERTATEVKVHIQASKDKDARNALRRLATKYPGKFDVEEWMGRLTADKRPFSGQATFHSRGVGSEETFRAVTKIALNAFIAAGGSKEAVVGAVEYVRGTSGATHARWYFADDVMPGRGSDEVAHIVAVRGAPGEPLWAYVELFRIYRFAVRLSARYAGPPVCLDYVYDLCAGEEIEGRALEVDFVGLDIEEPGIVLSVVEEQGNVLARVAQRRSREAAIGAAVTAAFEKARADNPEATGRDLQPHLWSELEPIFAAMIVGDRRDRRRLEQAPRLDTGREDIAVSKTSRGGESDDRVWVSQDGPRSVVVVCDGAGGLPGGAHAAEMATEWVQALCEGGRLPNASAGLQAVLRTLDEVVVEDALAGETTAIVAVIESGVIVGASVGDSEAWLIRAQDHLVLTADQHRKRLGSGKAAPVGFGPVALAGGRLLVASDGLFGHAPADQILAAARLPDLEGAAAALIELPRTSRGDYGDDVSVALVE